MVLSHTLKHIVILRGDLMIRTPNYSVSLYLVVNLPLDLYVSLTKFWISDLQVGCSNQGTKTRLECRESIRDLNLVF